MHDIPYGSWQSPLSAKKITETAKTPVDLMINQGQLYWLELRPQENSRLTLMTFVSGTEIELTPFPFNIRSQLHEYGGGAHLVEDNQVFFCNWEDQRVYQLNLETLEKQPHPITATGPYRYSDFQVDQSRNKLICVRESHTNVSALDPYPRNELITIDLTNYQQQTLVSGADFYSSPKLSPDNDSLCWLSWDHPHMPWDAAELHYAQLDHQGLANNPQHIAGNVQESSFQPEWDKDNCLVFISDRTGWWNLYRHDTRDATIANHGKHIQCLHKTSMEFGRPQWVCGQRTYGINALNEIICSYFQQGQWQLALLTDHNLEPIGSTFSDIKSVSCDTKQVYFIASTPDQADQIIWVDLDSLRRKVCPVIDQSAKTPAFQVHSIKGYLSQPTSITFLSSNEEEIQGYFYPPCNKDYPNTDTPPPPLIIKTHGGPSSCATSSLDLSIQYWTSRGFALFDINYRGSTGFGREFREKLYGQWGIYDVEDCLYGARHLIAQNKVNPDQLIIRGHSAGGYTTLCTLLFHDFFKAGASLYGICDLKKLSAECHKFESHYVEKLIGSEKEFSQRYVDRSPLYASQTPTCPIIFLQGLEDKVVPPNQSRLMADKLKQEGVPVAHIEFPEEGHGFRQQDNMIKALEAELYFYRRVFNLEDFENLPKIDIAHLD